MSIFTAEYWKEAAGELRSLKKLVMAALMAALSIAISTFYIPVGESLRVMFSFLVLCVGSAVYGPLMGILVGAVSDTVGYFVHPSGAYFPGYLLSAVLGCVIYALFLYRKKITVLRIFGAKFLVNYFVNVLVGSIWSAMLYGKGYLYYLLKSLIKNSILLPLEVILLSALFAALLPALSRMGLLPVHSHEAMQALKPGRSALLVFGADLLIAGAAGIWFGLTSERFVLWLGIGAGLLGLGLLAAALAVKLRGREKKEVRV